NEIAAAGNRPAQRCDAKWISDDIGRDRYLDHAAGDVVRNDLEREAAVRAAEFDQARRQKIRSRDNQVGAAASIRGRETVDNGWAVEVGGRGEIKIRAQARQNRQWTGRDSVRHIDVQLIFRVDDKPGARLAIKQNVRGIAAAREEMHALYADR